MTLPEQVGRAFRQRVLSRAVFVTGPARSGTSLLGNLLHSCEGCELAFEPPTLLQILAAMTDEPQDEILRAIEAYLTEDLLLGSLSGRSLNLRRRDESSAWKGKGAAEIEKRLQAGSRKSDLLELAGMSRLIVKVPDVVPKVRTLCRTFKGATAVVVVRDPIDTIVSWLSRGWLGQPDLEHGQRVWPVYRTHFGSIPHFIVPEDQPAFGSASECDRVAIHLERTFRTLLDAQDSRVVIYDELVMSPRQVVERLCRELGLVRTERTDTLIAEIHSESLSRSVPPDLDPARYSLLVRLYSEILRRHSIAGA